MDAESTTETRSTEAYLNVLAWLHANRKALTIGVTAAVVIGVVVGLMAWQKSQTETEAASHWLAVPLETVQNGQMAPTPAAPWMDVAKQFPNTSAGQYAELLAAKSLFTENKFPEARQNFTKFIEDHPESFLVPQAKVGVAACLEAEGKAQDAVQKYQDIIVTYPTESSIVSPAKLTEARLFEQLNKPDQAVSRYEELTRLGERSPWGAEAAERLEILLAKHPELRKAPAGSAAPGSSSFVIPGATPAPSAAPAPAKAPAAPAAKP